MASIWVIRGVPMQCSASGSRHRLCRFCEPYRMSPGVSEDSNVYILQRV